MVLDPDAFIARKMQQISETRSRAYLTALSQEIQKKLQRVSLLSSNSDFFFFFLKFYVKYYFWFILIETNYKILEF